MRPSSHRNQTPDRSCGDCVFSHLVAYKRDLLCFHGDKIRITGTSEYPVTAEFVELDGDDVSMMDGDQYDRVWAARIVDSDDICDEWQP